MSQPPCVVGTDGSQLADVQTIQMAGARASFASGDLFKASSKQ